MSNNQELKALEAELIEQCRLLGKSGEREAKHLSQIESLKKENLKLSRENKNLKEMYNNLIDLKEALEHKIKSLEKI